MRGMVAAEGERTSREVGGGKQGGGGEEGEMHGMGGLVN